MGTLLNAAAVIVGAGIGLLLGTRLSERVRTSAMQALGLVVLLIGLQGALQTQNVLILLLSMAVGGVLGAAMDIENRLHRLGCALERRLERSGGSSGPDAGSSRGAGRLSIAFVTSSLVFCVGPMSILGSLQDGLSGDFSTLAVKSLLDFIGAVTFASTLGPGVMLSAVTILVYQGGLTLAAFGVRDLLTEPMMREMTAAGGLMILGIGLRLLEIRVLAVANLLPALLLAPLLAAWLGPSLAQLLPGASG